MNTKFSSKMPRAKGPHKNKFCIIFTLGNRKLERAFEKPVELGEWCPCESKNCSGNDPDKMVVMLKSVCKQLYKERLEIAADCQCEKCKTLMPIDDWLSELPDDPDELHKRSFKLMSAIVSSHDYMAFKESNIIDLLIEEEYWKVINIHAPHISPRAKKRLKKEIQIIKNIDKIKEICSNYGRVGKVISNNKKKEITLTIFSKDYKEVDEVNSESDESDSELRSIIEEDSQNSQDSLNSLESNVSHAIEVDISENCMTCYANKVAKISICKICKYSHMCPECEIDMKNQFGYCPICNSKY